MAPPQVVNFKRASWSPEVETHLRNALRYRSDMDIIRDQVNRGISELWIDSDDQTHMVTRIEGPELVIVAYEGCRARENFKRLWEHCKARGFESIRIHTQQPWIIQMLADFRPEPIEHVVRFFINGRQESKRNFYGQPAEYDNREHTKH